MPRIIICKFDWKVVKPVVEYLEVGKANDIPRICKKLNVTHILDWQADHMVANGAVDRRTDTSKAGAK